MLSTGRERIRRVGLGIGLVAAVVLASPVAAWGGTVEGGMVVRVEAEAPGVGCGDYTFALTGNWTFDGDEEWNIPGPIPLMCGETELGSVEGISIRLRSDPQVDLSFNVRAGSTTAVTNFTINSALISFAPLPNPYAYATASVGVTDTNLNGATLTGLFAGGKAYQAQYNGASVVFANLISTPVTAGIGGSASADERLPSLPTWCVLLSDTVSDISSQYKFSLTKSDRANGTSTFAVGYDIPEPATLCLLALGGAVLGGRRRR